MIEIQVGDVLIDIDEIDAERIEPEDAPPRTQHGVERRPFPHEGLQAFGASLMRPMPPN